MKIWRVFIIALFFAAQLHLGRQLTIITIRRRSFILGENLMMR